jgi:hypothetical protein
MRFLVPFFGVDLSARICSWLYVRLRVHRFILAGRRFRRWAGLSW